MTLLLPINLPNVAEAPRHSIAAYDRKTDELISEIAVPALLDPFALKIASVGQDDPVGALSYSLAPRESRILGFVLNIDDDLNRAELFLEPCTPKPKVVDARTAEAISILARVLGPVPARHRRQGIIERDLTVPTLRHLDRSNRGWESTSDLIRFLTDLFRPSGREAALLSGRIDSYFSQIVRNMVSHRFHRTSFISNRLAEYSADLGTLRITERGRSILRAAFA